MQGQKTHGKEKDMTQKKARHMMMEVSRRIYMNANGTLKGFGKISRFYNDQWKPRFGEMGINSYDDAWNMDAMVALRKTVGM